MSAFAQMMFVSVMRTFNVPWSPAETQLAGDDGVAALLNMKTGLSLHAMNLGLRGSIDEQAEAKFIERACAARGHVSGGLSHEVVLAEVTAICVTKETLSGPVGPSGQCAELCDVRVVGWYFERLARAQPPPPPAKPKPPGWWKYPPPS